MGGPFDPSKYGLGLLEETDWTYHVKFNHSDACQTYQMNNGLIMTRFLEGNKTVKKALILRPCGLRVYSIEWHGCDVDCHSAIRGMRVSCGIHGMAIPIEEFWR